jgi:hypothetical protein
MSIKTARLVFSPCRHGKLHVIDGGDAAHV